MHNSSNKTAKCFLICWGKFHALLSAYSCALFVQCHFICGNYILFHIYQQHVTVNYKCIVHPWKTKSNRLHHAFSAMNALQPFNLKWPWHGYISLFLLLFFNSFITLYSHLFTRKYIITERYPRRPLHQSIGLCTVHSKQNQIYVDWDTARWENDSCLWTGLIFLNFRWSILFYLMLNETSKVINSPGI